jgi:hypothetical protein
MRKALRFAAAGIIAGALALPVGGAALAGPCGGTIGGDTVPELGPAPGIVDAGGVAYVDVRNVDSDGFLYSIWIYQESNGAGGLQRGGKAIEPINTALLLATGAEDTETCNESATPDALIL